MEAQDGSGYDPNVTAPDEGKNAIYHSFDFQNPDLVSAGTILNFPETDDVTGEPLYVAEVPCLGSIKDDDGNIPVDDDGNYIYECNPNPIAGELITDWKGDPIFAYENARRPRFILQSKTSAFGGFKSDGFTYKEPNNSGTVLIVLYKEGEEGKGRPSDIMARRCVVKDEFGNIKSGNPWSPANFIPQTPTDSRLAHSERQHDDAHSRPGSTPIATRTPRVTASRSASGSRPKTISATNPAPTPMRTPEPTGGRSAVTSWSWATPTRRTGRPRRKPTTSTISTSAAPSTEDRHWGTDPNASVDVVHRDIFIDPGGHFRLRTVRDGR